MTLANSGVSGGALLVSVTKSAPSIIEDIWHNLEYCIELTTWLTTSTILTISTVVIKINTQYTWPRPSYLWGLSARDAFVVTNRKPIMSKHSIPQSRTLSSSSSPSSLWLLHQKQDQIYSMSECLSQQLEIYFWRFGLPRASLVLCVTSLVMIHYPLKIIRILCHEWKC